MRKLRRHYTKVNGQVIWLRTDEECDGYRGILNKGDVREYPATKKNLVSLLSQVQEDGLYTKTELRKMKKAELEQIANNWGYLQD